MSRKAWILALLVMVGGGFAAAQPADAAIVVISFTGLDVGVSYDGTDSTVTSSGYDPLDSLTIRVDNSLVYAGGPTDGDAIDLFLEAPGPLGVGNTTTAVSGHLNVITPTFLGGSFFDSNVLSVFLRHSALSFSGLDGLATVVSASAPGILNPVVFSFTMSNPPGGTNFAAVLDGSLTFEYNPIPEPSTMVLAGLGVVGLGVMRVVRRRRSPTTA